MLTLTPAETNATTGEEPDINIVVRELQQRLRLTHRQILSQRIMVALGALFVALCAYIAGIAAIDWLLELSTAWRAAGLFVVVAASAAATVLVWQRWLSRSTLSDTAAEAERRLTKFGQRLRTTLDYQLQQPRPSAASPSLINSLHQETFKIAEETEWASAVDRRPLWQMVSAVGAVVLPWILTLVVWPEFRIAAGRALLLPLEYSTVTYAPQTQVFRLGESIVITANIVGRPISSAQLRFRRVGEGSEWTTVDFVNAKPEAAAADAVAAISVNAAATNAVNAATEGMSAEHLQLNRLHGELSVVLHELVDDTEFEVLAGPRSLPPGLLRILQPLTLSKVAARITPPAYTLRAEEKATTLDLRVLEGSLVNLQLEFNRQPSKVTLRRLVQPSDNIESQTDAAGTDHAATEISLVTQDQFATAVLSDLRQSATFMLTAQTADGMSLDEQQLNIRVQPDLKPRIAFIQPEEELIVTATTEVPMLADAADDLGLYKTGILFQIGTGPLQTLIEQDAEGSTDEFRLSARLMLEEHRLSIREAVTYYAFAEDNYFDQARRTTTPLRYIDIRPYKIEYQVDESEGGAGTNDGSSLTLEELISRQRQTLTQSFTATQQPVAKEILTKFVNSQEDLKVATAEFSAGMAERGAADPALDEAMIHMASAIESLNTGRLTDAVAAEQMALAALICARQNLRNILKQSNSQSPSQPRKFDRQQRQKLRTPKKKNADQQEQLAKTRQQLEQLAEREREWSKQAQQCVGNAASQSQSQSSLASSAAPSPSATNASEAEGPKLGSEAAKTPSPAELAAAQEKLQAELAELEKQLEQLEAASQPARNQAGQAAESMQKGLEELQKENGDAAAREGERAAEQLEQLSDHLAAMNTQDFGQRLEQAQQLAQQLSARQSTLDRKLRQSANAPGEQESKGENGSQSPNSSGTAEVARDQQALAAQTEMLAEFLERLQRDAVAESIPVHQKLEQASAENPPRDIAAGMRRAADDLQAQRPSVASRGATEAAKRLQELSKLLDSARGEFAQPQLKELLALEEQLAQLQEQAKKAGDQAQPQTAADQKWQQLEPRLDKLAASDQRIAEAMRQLREGAHGDKSSSTSLDGTQKSEQRNAENSDANKPGYAPPTPGSQLTPREFTEPNDQPTPEGFYSWRALANSSGMREVSKALQTKIQEAILAGALLDADQTVPPAYKELVEKYYRALSDDLR